MGKVSKKELERRKNTRLGEEIINKHGSKMKIIEYNHYDDITVEFEDGYTEKCRYDTFKRGGVLNWSDKFVLGIGYKGKGKYKIKENGRTTFLYNEWHSMLARCYNENQQLRSKTSAYVGCTVCEEWHNFQNFAKWYEDNYYDCEGENMRLDKDILVKGNKIYSPETCIIVPERINILLITGSTNNKSGYPGVDKRSENSYRARCSVTDKLNGNKVLTIASFNNPLEAFYAYKSFKEKYIKQVADEYKDRIPKKLYYAMYRYEVEITD